MKLVYNTKRNAIFDNGDPDEVQNRTDGKNTEEIVILREEIRKVQKLISRIPLSEQRALRMKKICGASDREIAEALGISINSVSQYVRRAQKKLLRMYQDEEEEI